jgi:DNA-binding response OmpR family regulator
MTARPVLVIDDDALWCAQVCRYLAPRGYQVIVAASEAAALDYLSAGHSVSAIFVEPGTADGAFCQVMRRLPELESVPIFLVSESSAGVVYSKGHGANGYVRKTVLLDHLMLLLQMPNVPQVLRNAPRSDSPVNRPCAAPETH